MNEAINGIGPSTLAVQARDAAALISVSRSQFWRLHAAGRIPLPIYLGTKCPRWRVDELQQWLAAGAPDRLTWQKLKAARA